MVTGAVTAPPARPGTLVADPPSARDGHPVGGRAGLRQRPFRWFTPALGTLLLGYLFFSRSFAYLHVPGTPVFVGEIVLGIGIMEAVHLRPPWIRMTRSSPVLLSLAVFMGWCTARLLIDVPTYGLDAIRDSAIWYYGLFAFVVAVAATRDPTFLPRLARWYGRALPWFLLWAPLAIVLAEVDALSAITVPDSATPINAFKSGDMAVQIAMALGYLVLGLHRLAGPRWSPRAELALAALAVLSLLVAGTQNRGGLAAGLVLLGIATLHLPTARRRGLFLPVTATLVVAIALVAILDLRVPGQRRDVSVQQVVQNVTSVVGSEGDQDLSGTVEWRQSLWRQVVDDLERSSAWLTGLGFGPILPDRYDIPLDPNAPPLRNVHNSHLTILARVGYVVFGLWLVFWVTWAVHLERHVRRRGGVREPRGALAVWLLASTTAIVVNAIFDPALEGPQAAVWMFVLVGLGAALAGDRRGRALPTRTRWSP